MKKSIITLLSLIAFSSCSTVENGEVGILFNLYADKGVQEETVGPGRYWVSTNEYLYIFPTYRQNKVWTRDDRGDSKGDEGFNFQSINGLKLDASVGIEYVIEEENVVKVFQLYKKGVDEITNKVLRNATRDAFNRAGSTRTVEEIYGSGKTKFIKEVKELIVKKAKEKHITVTDFYLIGSIGIPQTITKALNAKIEATQKAQQRENELQMSIAQQKKDSVEAEASAQKQRIEADAYAYSVTKKATAQAKANKELSKSLTSTLVEYKKLEKWDGKLPQVSGSNGGLIMNLK